LDDVPKLMSLPAHLPASLTFLRLCKIPIIDSLPALPASLEDLSLKGMPKLNVTAIKEQLPVGCELEFI